jgi:hypothetical protein
LGISAAPLAVIALAVVLAACPTSVDDTPQANSKEITGFSFASPEAAGDISGTSISVTVPYGTALTALVPTITHSGASVTPASGTAQDFSSPVTYTVTAEDGSTREYTVTVTVGAAPKEITGFSFADPPATGVIDGTSISVAVSYGTALTALVPTITHSGASINPASGTAQDFSSPVTYTVTAEDGNTQAYTITVTPASEDSTEITSFSFADPQAAGVIDGTSISVTVPYGTVLTSLVPMITHLGANVTPASGSPQDFSSPVTYTVTAHDGSTVGEYTVTVTAESPSDSKAITGFSFADPPAAGVVDGTNITVTVPAGTVLTALVPTITHSGESISPASGSPQDFSSPVTYTVTAQDGSTQAYTVTVTAAAAAAPSSDSKEITGFSFASPQAAGVIDGTNITVTVPAGTVLTALVPTITHSGESISPASGGQQDFSSPVTYTVTAQDGSTQAYTVTVTTAPPLDSKVITGFSFADPLAAGVIDGTNITVIVPIGTSLTALLPTITQTGARIDPLSGTPQDFSSPVTYTVTAQDGSTQAYTVTVRIERQGGKITLIYPLDEAANELSGGAVVVSKPDGEEILTVSGAFDSCRWRVDGVIRGYGDTFTLNAGEYTPGIYQISLEVILDGEVFSKSGSFTVQ